MNERTPLWCALALANRGWKVFPLAPSSKQPLGSMAPNGFHSASNDHEQLRKWWTARPDAGVGLALKDSGLVCVDVDSRNGGLETLERLEAQHGKVESEVMAYTPGGGMHFVFAAQLVGNLPGTLGKGIDLKADGYICVEPTIHPNGKALPGWIRDLARAPLQAPAAVVSNVPPMATDRRQSLIQALGHVDADSRESWLAVGMAIHNELPTAEGFDLWSQWSQSSPKFDAKDQLHVWRSFKPRGLAGVGVNSIFKMAQQAGWRNVPAAGAVAEPEAEAPLLPILNVAQLEAASGSITWAVKHVVPGDSLGVVFGASGTFKSFVALDYAMHQVHGLPWLGKKTKPGPVLFIAAEGGAGVWRRVKAWHLARNLRWEGIQFYVLPIAVMLNTEAQKVVQAAQAIGVAPTTVIVDTMSQTFDGEENSANEVAGYFRELGNRFRALWRCVVLVVHHSGHSATERPRGSSAILANVDFMLGVFRDEKEMIATVTCEKQKDGERFEPVEFALQSVQLGQDEDGEAISSLAASHLSSHGALLAAKAAEARAGRGGRDQMLYECAQTGITEKQWRHEFYKLLPAEMDAHARKVAFYRARDALVKQKRIDLGAVTGSMEKLVIVLGEES
jgi:hypothetical protein